MAKNDCLLKFAAWLSCAALFCGSTSSANAADQSPPAGDFQAKALATLRQALADETQFVKVHAAEALLALSYGEDVLPVFQEELELHGDEPHYRTGIWRVLAQATYDREVKAEFLEKLRSVYLDANSPDRVHALEALAKLRYTVSQDDRLRSAPIPDSADALPCLRWLLAVSGNDKDVRALAGLLDDSDASVRGLAAYALRHLSDELPADVVEKLGQVAAKETESKSRVYVIGSAFAVIPNGNESHKFKERLLAYATAGNAKEKYEVAAVLAVCGTKDDVPLLNALLNDPDIDVRISAANAILRIERRVPLSFSWLDWAVLGGYGIGMMSIGWYYSRVKNVEEYLLGGRNMKPWAVGISLYATLMSTLTYLALPGEMISHGPLFLGALFSYPLVYLVASRFIIPYIMKLRVTSAYEILERRLGLSVRMLGSVYFLLLRLLWMSLIVYATSSEVLVPLLGLDASATPWVCIVMAVVTIAYTAMGGLQAVVFTDVVQTFIMIAGALLSLALITYSLGGIGAWWPTSWSPHWDKPTLFDPSVRIPWGMALVSQFTWYVCTISSDQMAIQRYLATRDAQAARRMFRISLTLEVSVVLLLASLGLALFAYFRANPSMLPDGASLTTNTDRLLPQYIVRVLPAGISGLVIAGILSAAMDSLSSGLNASCSVITVDWIDRFRRVKLHGKAHVRQARIVSWLVGMAVVVVSLFASFVPGNLLEKCYTVVNVLVTPLFILFFMAMFVSWATTLGTWIGSLAALSTAIAVAHWNLLGLSFIWVMPGSLIVGVLVACTASLLPIGVRRPMLQMDQAAS